MDADCRKKRSYILHQSIHHYMQCLECFVSSEGGALVLFPYKDSGTLKQDRFATDPQRFEEILSEITTGYGNLGSSFENKIVAEILEEMNPELVEEMLDVELAALVRHYVRLYGRQVDYMYQRALDEYDALAATPAPSAAAATATAAAGFSHITLQPSASATRHVEPPRPPPMLPRVDIELQPREASALDAPLRDLDGEPVGTPADYHVTGRMHDGYLLDDLEVPLPPTEQPALRPLPLLEPEQALAPDYEFENGAEAELERAVAALGLHAVWATQPPLHVVTLTPTTPPLSFAGATRDAAAAAAVNFIRRVLPPPPPPALA